MKILYLYAELMGYQIPVLEQYVKVYQAEVHVIHWDKKKLTPYNPPILDNVTYYNRSEYNLNKMKVLANDLKPSIVYVSGWMDKDYLKICRLIKKNGGIVVAGSDTQWKGSLKQKLASLIFPFTLKKCFTHIWVAGTYQFEYAIRLGFKRNEIIFNSLSANTELFGEAMRFIRDKTSNYPKQFLYVGNFRNVKGTDILIEAYKIYKEKYNGEWHLTCVGNGEYSERLLSYKNISVRSFTSQQDLVELTKEMGVFVLPSRFDQWGLVVHEFSSAGMPLILSENVGAISTFFIEGFNGHKYKNNSPEELANAMLLMSNKSKEELISMGNNSHLLSQRIDPKIAAASFMSALKD